MITCATHERRRFFQAHSNASLMCDTLQHYRSQGKYQLHAYVVMPDHIHVLLTPSPEVSLEKAVQCIKGGFSFRLRSRAEVWGRGRFDRRIGSGSDYEACVRYIHQNPVRARLAISSEEFLFSSARGTHDVDPAPDWFVLSIQG